MSLLGRFIAAIRGQPLPYAVTSANPSSSLFWDPRLRQSLLLSTGAIETRLLTTKLEQLQSYQGWIYAAASAIAQDIRSNPWIIYKKGKDKQNEDEWTPIDEANNPPILSRPNFDQSWGDFIETSSLHLDLTGELFWYLIGNGNGPNAKLAGLQCLVPSWVRAPVFSDDGVTLVAWKIEIPGRPPRTIPAEEIIFTRYPHPTEPFRGASPVEAFALSHEMDTYSRGYGLTLLKNRAQPDGILSSDQQLTLDQANLARERWRDTHETPGEIAVLGQGMRYQPTAQSLNDMQFGNFAQITRDQILSIYKVPAAKLGLVTDSNRANSEAADQTYKENAILPRLQRLEEKINLFLMPRLFGKQAVNLWFEFESPVDEDRQFELTKADTLFKAGATTVNEYREALELPTLDGEDGNLYFLPTGAKPVRSLADEADAAVAAAEALLNPPQPAGVPADGKDNTDPTPANAKSVFTEADYFDAAEDVAILLDQRKQLRRSLVEERFLRVQDRLEAGLKSSARRIFSREQRLMVDGYKTSSEARIVPGTTQVRGWVEDALDATQEEWEAEVAEYIRRSAREGWNLAQQDLEHSISWSLFQDTAAAYATYTAARKVVAIQEFTRTQVQKIITVGVEDGSTVDEIANRLRETYDGFKGVRAEIIARTETASAVNYGKLSSAQEAETQLGLTITKEWLATQDERTRETHAEADGEVVPLGNKFRVGQSFLDHPGDPDGPAEEVINCRCTIVTSSE